MSHLPPTVRPPTEGELRAAADRFHLDLSEEELADFMELVSGQLAVYEAIAAMTEPKREHTSRERDPGYRPGTDEDPNNAHLRICEVRGADAGPLAGYEVGVKDNIAVAGVEMTAGSVALEGYVPSEDAVAVRRLLDAGATVTRKNNMDALAVSGSGEPTPTGPIINPHSDDHLAGGSSGGSAVAVATGDVDVAVGTDQAGSLRVPAAWSGCVGLKPTHGLVPYTGAMQQGVSWDHVGPMARTVEDAAKLLQVLAGPHPSDPRSRGMSPGDYVGSLDAGADGLTVGVLEEGFGTEHNEPGVDRTVEAAIDGLADAGAGVERVSVPRHADGVLIALGVEVEDLAAMWEAEGVGHYVGGTRDRQFAAEFAKARRASADDFAPTVKQLCLLGGYLREHHHSRFYTKAVNLAQALTSEYEAALEGVDVLAMPTAPTTAFEIESDLSRVELVSRSQGKAGRTQNTMPFNLSGHPAVSVPAGTSDGLPVGLMLVAGQGAEETLVRAGAAAEAAVDWDPRAAIR
ncbi:amidase family protein [Haloglomus litoreum]|uniref:amidase family protein n=1 Tax=Haloglomus litoreum TaxID=3034026 RepID=UPI0023E88E69|nr:amidase family protein [Haloglomus sp. DT116]